MCITTKEYVKKATAKWGNKFDYSKTVYQGYYRLLTVTCRTCDNEWTGTPSNHLEWGSCKYCCFKKQRKTTQVFIDMARKIHKNQYDYSQTNYVNAKTKVTIICRKCGQSFQQLPRGHIYEESGCPKCRFSKGELAVAKILMELQIPFITNYKFQGCKKQNYLSFDFYVELFNTCIEFDGKQHYDESSKFYSKELIENDKLKTEFCKKQGINLLRIPYWEFKNIREKIKIFISEIKNLK